MWLLLGGGHVWLLRGGLWLLWGACMVALGGMCGCLGGMCGCSRGDMHGCSQGDVCGCSQGAGMVALGVCMVAPRGCMVAPRGHAWLLWGACMVAPGGHAWDTTRYGDMINERAVRILLECILVLFPFGYQGNGVKVKLSYGTLISLTWFYSVETCTK